MPTPSAHGRLILHRSRVAAGNGPDRRLPGTVLTPGSPDAIRVATGAGVLEILELQVEGGKVLPAQAFSAGHPLSPRHVWGRRDRAGAPGGPHRACGARVAWDGTAGGHRGRSSSPERSARSSLADRARHGHRAHAQALDHQLDPADNAPLEGAGRRGADRPPPRRLSADLSGPSAASAAVNDAVALTKRSGKTSAAGLVNAVLRALAAPRAACPGPTSRARRRSPLVIRIRSGSCTAGRHGGGGGGDWLAFRAARRAVPRREPAAGTREALAARLNGGRRDRAHSPFTPRPACRRGVALPPRRSATAGSSSGTRPRS